MGAWMFPEAEFCIPYTIYNHMAESSSSNIDFISRSIGDNLGQTDKVYFRCFRHFAGIRLSSQRCVKVPMFEICGPKAFFFLYSGKLESLSILSITL